MSRQVRDHAPVLDRGGAVQGGLEGDALCVHGNIKHLSSCQVTHLVVYHHHPDHVPTGLDPLQHFVHVDIYVN